MSEPSAKPQRKYRLGVPMSWSVGCLAWPVVGLIAVALGSTIYFILQLPERMMTRSRTELEAVGRDLRNAFVDIAHLQPRITINNRVYLEQTRPTTELSIVSRRLEIEHEFQSTWAGSSKRVKLHGTFLAKAGFDLRQSFSIDLRPDEVVVQLPHAQILGVEQQQVDVLAFENGFWNRISADDVENELSILPQLARQKAIEANLPTEAERSLQEQLKARLHLSQPLRLIFTTSARQQ